MDYKVLNIITEQDRIALIKLYNSIPSTKAAQDYNLFTVDKRRIQSDNFKIDAFKKLDDYADRPTYSHYFVMYEEGSFTRMHTDNDDEISVVHEHIVEVE